MTLGWLDDCRGRSNHKAVVATAPSKHTPSTTDHPGPVSSSLLFFVELLELLCLLLVVLLLPLVVVVLRLLVLLAWLVVGGLVVALVLELEVVAELLLLVFRA
jgi:hypothetical protein